MPTSADSKPAFLPTDNVVIDGPDFYNHPSAETLAEVEKWKAARLEKDKFACLFIDANGHKLFGVVSIDDLFTRGNGRIRIPRDSDEFQNTTSFTGELLIQRMEQNKQLFAGIDIATEQYQKLGLSFGDRRGDWHCSTSGRTGLYISRHIVVMPSEWRSDYGSFNADELLLSAEGLRRSFEQTFSDFKIEPMALNQAK